MSLFLTISPCRNRGPHIECPAVMFMGETVGHVGTWFICVKMVSDSRFLIHFPNTTLTNTRTKNFESGTNFALYFHFATFGLIFKIEHILLVNGPNMYSFPDFELLKQKRYRLQPPRRIVDAMKEHIELPSERV